MADEMLDLDRYSGIEGTQLFEKEMLERFAGAMSLEGDGVEFRGVDDDPEGGELAHLPDPNLPPHIGGVALRIPPEQRPLELLTAA